MGGYVDNFKTDESKCRQLVVLVEYIAAACSKVEPPPEEGSRKNTRQMHTVT